MTAGANRCFIFDIDGTLADCGHRVHHVNGTKKNWPAFMEGIPHDGLIAQTAMINRLLSTVHKDTPIFLCSGRSENEREMTEKWLKEHEVQYTKMYMRPAGDYRADYIVKKEMLDQIRSDGFEPFLVIDDRQCVVDMWRDNGLFVLQCDPKANFTNHENHFQFHESIEWPLTVLVGPSGAGKSTWCLKERVNATERAWYGDNAYISSDQIRQEICGDFQDQSKNQRVFETMHEVATARLKRGLPVLLDATHIRTADRVKAATLVPDHIKVRYVVLNRSMEVKKRDGEWRNAVNIKGRPLMEQHEQTFKSNIKAILSGDGLPNVTVFDFRTEK